jgi:hypothetical protein
VLHVGLGRGEAKTVDGCIGIVDGAQRVFELAPAAVIERLADAEDRPPIAGWMKSLAVRPKTGSPLLVFIIVGTMTRLAPRRKTGVESETSCAYVQAPQRTSKTRKTSRWNFICPIGFAEICRIDSCFGLLR